MEEVWKDVQGFEGLYQVSNMGRVGNGSRQSLQLYQRGSICNRYKSGNYQYVLSKMLHQNKDRLSLAIRIISKPKTSKCVISV